MYINIVKPAGDFLTATIVLIIASPLLVFIIVLLAIANNGKVWFRQTRPGRHEKAFKIVKFKTMTDKRDQAGELLSDGERLTWIGKLIRKTSIDELPQLINVLKGEMSIVGPRPLLMEYLPYYSDEQRKRHLAKPGITGWAQVNGRNTITWQQKFEYDVWYVNHISFALDVRILVLTLVKVFKANDINSKTAATMERFDGKK